MNKLFPKIEAFATGMLPVDEIHTIYWEKSGNPSGIPIFVFHGGPGGGTSPNMRRFFDPKYYLVIMFDQRGAGKSTPYAEIRNNTTEDLIADIEKLRSHLNIEQFHIFGGSWGSTLALAYTEEYPDNCLGIIMRGIFTMRACEVDWFMHKMGHFYPEAFSEFISFLPEQDRDNPLEAYYKLLNGDDINLRDKAASHWVEYECACARHTRTDEHRLSDKQGNNLAIARIEAHYFIKNQFTPNNKLILNAHKLKDIKIIIVQGRYDIICPIKTAYELQQEIPHAKMVIVADAGHASSDPAMQLALLQATEEMKATGA